MYIIYVYIYHPLSLSLSSLGLHVLLLVPDYIYLLVFFFIYLSFYGYLSKIPYCIINSIVFRLERNIVMARDILAWRHRDTTTAPPLLKYRSSYWFILTTVSFAVFTVRLIIPYLIFQCQQKPLGRKIKTNIPFSVTLGHFSVRHCKATSPLITYVLALLAGVFFSYHLILQIVPVIPFALTTRVGVPEQDGTSQTPSPSPKAFLMFDPRHSQSNTGFPSSSPSTAHLSLVLPVCVPFPGSPSPHPPTAD